MICRVAGTSYNWAQLQMTLFHGPQMPYEGFIGSQVIWSSTKKVTGEKMQLAFLKLWLEINFTVIRGLLGDISWLLLVETFSKSFSPKGE